MVGLRLLLCAASRTARRWGGKHPFGPIVEEVPAGFGIHGPPESIFVLSLQSANLIQEFLPAQPAFVAFTPQVPKLTIELVD